MDNLLYIHGFNSSGSAFKARLMMRLLDDYQTASPTIDYLSLSPYAVMDKIEALVGLYRPKLTVGSSLGGYYAIAAAAKLGIPVLAVNPCVDPVPLMESVADGMNASADPRLAAVARRQLADYRRFQEEVFEPAAPGRGLLNLALSTDDELLGDHRHLETRYPERNKTTYMDRCGHHFLRFGELVPWIREILQSV